MVGAVRFELTTSCTRNKRASQATLRPEPKCGRNMRNVAHDCNGFLPWASKIYRGRSIRKEIGQRPNGAVAPSSSQAGSPPITTGHLVGRASDRFLRMAASVVNRTWGCRAQCCLAAPTVRRRLLRCDCPQRRAWARAHQDVSKCWINQELGPRFRRG